MKYIIETQRFYLRELDNIDLEDMFELDSDPDVHLYIENQPVTSHKEILDVIAMIRKQYQDFGIARWAVIDKDTLECVGWCGLKFITFQINGRKNFHELGYRFKKKHWGKGIATETAKAVLNYGFSNLNLSEVFAVTHLENRNSMHVLQKIGFVKKAPFQDDNGHLNWFELTKENWKKLNS